MKSILITSLRDEINLVQAGHLIASLKKEHPGANTVLLTFKEFENAARSVSDPRDARFIDRRKIEHLKSGALYSDAFALNAFMEGLEDVLETEWDQVVNFSNDEISGYLIPMLSADKVSGASVSPEGNVRTSDRWAAYRNFYLADNSHAPLDPVTCAHHSAGVPFCKDADKIILNQDFTMTANQNFSRIRNAKGEGETFVIGLNLAAAQDGSRYAVPFLADLVETLESSREYKPILLLQGKEEEKALANELNKQFNNSLISVNMDISAMPSVLANLDCLVTKPNTACALADALDTKIIETTSESGSSAAVNAGNFLIQVLNEEHASDDVLFLLNQENGTVLPMAVKDSDNKVYATTFDDTGLLRTLIRGAVNLEEELEYHISRCHHHALLGYPVDRRLLENLRENVDKKAIADFVSKSKEELTSSVKTLLAALRSLRSMKQSERNAPKFIQYLDQLIRLGRQRHIAQAAVCLFEADLENIDAADPDKNMEELERCLFTLKGDLQGLTKIFESLLSNEEGQESQKEL